MTGSLAPDFNVLLPGPRLGLLCEVNQTWLGLRKSSEAEAKDSAELKLLISPRSAWRGGHFDTWPIMQILSRILKSQWCRGEQSLGEAHT